ncbi:SusC/RagA family TonB-linked outer membrane protein [Sphingobacterium litopenaei]|uniref:TonB-dependent receptor n=1 Tax=Sphingobacterium litopenaei TaxID=2763500 RepID=A0ABR7YCW5_9SPHI|nr:TonB-dependent receptor [Sphingobacterium litopenaei]MBD1429143.1 TonB-dependent receptor [Sphingobacterium litopenaei]
MISNFYPNEGFRRFVWVSSAVACCLCITVQSGYANTFESLKITSPQQNITVKGTVRDPQTNQPIAGVTVSVVGTTIATTTNANGQYELKNVPTNSQLSFSMIGMQAITENVNNRATIDVMLSSDNEIIDEVVVVGYGTQKRSVVSGAVTAVKGDELAKSSSVNLSNGLAGRLPGVTAIQSSGEPGYDGSNIRIRGINSLAGGNSSPLIVIDGVPSRAGGIDRLNPNDIESVSVLKDASAAIYGSRAGNGVILITTKQGKSGKPQLSYDGFYGIQRPTRTPKMASSPEYAEILNELRIFGSDLDPQFWGEAWNAFKTTGSYARPDKSETMNAAFNPEEMQKFKDGSDPYRYPNTDWFDEVFKNWSPQQRHNIQINGGGDNTTYLASLGYTNQDAYYKKSAAFYNQYDLRLNIESKINDYLTTTISVVGREEERNFPTVGAGDIFRFIMRGRPNEPAFWPHGEPGPAIEYGYNPVVSTTDLTGFNKTVDDYLQTTGKLDFKIPGVEGLKLTGTAALDKQWKRGKNWQTPWTLYTWDKTSFLDDGTPKLTGSVSSPFTDARLSENTASRLGVNLTGMISYDKVINDHSISLLAALTRETDKSNGFNAYRRYFLSTLIPELSFGESREQNIGVNDLFTRARLSYFGRVNYNYQEKYLAEFLWRVDGSYIFPENKRFGFFPGVSVGWVLSKEDFFKENVQFVNNLKLRASWGQMGAEAYYNDALQEFKFLTLMNTGSGVFNDQLVKTLWEANVPNENFTWEVANNSNLGLDATFMDNKFAFTFDYFFNERSNILTQKIASVPESTGIPSANLPPENIGKVRNSGYEFSLNYQTNINDFTFGVGVNGGYAKNKIIFFDEIPGAPEWQRATGRVTGAWLLYQYDGVFKDIADVNANTLDYSAVTGGASLRPGDMKFVDYNNDGKINGDDLVRMNKNSTPTFTGGFNLNAAYKGFDLTALIQGATGGLQMIGITESGDIGNYLNWSYENRWSIDNPSSEHPRLSNRNTAYYQDGSKAVNNSYWVRNNNYIRLKNIELGYTLNPEITNKIGVKGLRLYVNGLNLITIDKIKVWDPESTNSSGQYYPQAKVINFGLKASL